LPNVDGYRRSSECATVESLPEAEAACELTSAYPRSYGNDIVKFHGPVPLHVQLCGLTILHPFYIVDDSKAGLAPATGGYDLMDEWSWTLTINFSGLARLIH